MIAVAERFVLSIKRECVSRMIPFGTRHLEHAVREDVRHDDPEPPRHGLGNEPLNGRPETGTGAVVVRERLGGLLNHYHRAA